MLSVVLYRYDELGPWVEQLSSYSTPVPSLTKLNTKKGTVMKKRT